MGKLDLSRELEYANRCAKEFIDSADSLEKKYADLLSTAFAAACRVCFQFGDNRPLEIMDLLLLLRAKWEMHRQEFADLRFDGWPETPDMVFNVFEGNSARELAGKFTAAVVERLYAADKQGVLFAIEEEGKADESALNEWALRAAAELRNRLRMNNPEIFKENTDSLILKLDDEAERFFAGKKLPPNLITLPVAVKEFLVSRATLKRLIAKGKLHSYRSPKAAKNAPHLVDAREVAAYFPRKK